MSTDQTRPGNNIDNESNERPSTVVVQNPNPKANENIRVRTEEPQSQNNEPAQGVGSEITDGEDA